ncbi:hypothetical protein [Agromyces aerolatus]|uniref:hypothetical protein n=1 Tax=Agromyces sp. LY-1074 TaxID=3074080 RepID=UPI00285D4A9C|nr:MULTISPECIES: hypothetical protein [unclassified Agromyces]MDR5699857.1 hypothetical protein [Agromyces sp. LY-1074]MDR5706331.1 hypothetical protein [Agromyces sp. LY-1358]
MSAPLPPEYELSFLVGEVARDDVFVESEARVLWRVLHEAELVGEMQRDFGRLIPQVRRALHAPSVPEAFRTIAVNVLDATLSAHRERNALVHDQWVSLVWAPGELRSARTSRSRQLSDLRECAAALKVLTWRMRGVHVIAPRWLGLVEEDDVVSAADIRSWTRVAMGHIANDPHRVVGTAGPAPMPPGL